MSGGITGFGAYIPQGRLLRSEIAGANAWFDASLKGLGRGERSMCNWDEDVITMGVEAAGDCLAGFDGHAPPALYFASTTFPFLDRQNSVVLLEALNLPRQALAVDVGASQRAGTSSLLALLQGAGDGMVVASEHRRAKAGSRGEMLWGDAAAAVTTGGGPVIAEFLGGQSLAADFVDHYRGGEFDYDWEERWIRDEGYLKIIPEAVEGLLASCKVDAADIAHFILPTEQARAPGAVAKKLGIAAGAIADNQAATVGVAGAAQPLLLLAAALESAKPGELILLTGFGQGCDALLFRATDAIGGFRPARGVSGALAARREERNYAKFLAFNDLVERDTGKRGETDRQTYLSGYNRRRDLVTSFLGGKCRICGTVQIPREKYCVNPECHALDSQDPYPFADKRGEVLTWTADRLTFDPSPPAYFGMVRFDGGGKLMMDFTEVDEGGIESGSRISVHFRVRQYDPQRGFRKYFWKAKILREPVPAG